MKIKETEAAIEAILFAMGGSVELPRIAKAIGVDEKTTGRIIRNMMDRYQEENRGIQIIELENSFQMCTKKEYYEYLACPPKGWRGDIGNDTFDGLSLEKPVHRGEAHCTLQHSLFLFLVFCNTGGTIYSTRTSSARFSYCLLSLDIACTTEGVAERISDSRDSFVRHCFGLHRI